MQRLWAPSDPRGSWAETYNLKKVCGSSFAGFAVALRCVCHRQHSMGGGPLLFDSTPCCVSAPWFHHSFQLLLQIVGANVLVAFNAGEYAEALEGKSDEAIKNEIMSVLRTTYGNGIPEPKQVGARPPSRLEHAFSLKSSLNI